MDRQPLTAAAERQEPLASFSARVRAGFSKQASAYECHAALQRAIAWRLAHLCGELSLPPGPAADLGAGSGLLAQALATQHCPAARGRRLLQLDLCPELLARNPFAGSWGARVWDLERGLPPDLDAAALLASSFALQWLSQPARQLEHWCGRLAPGGWLLLAVPTAASFPQWHRAAERAGVPFTGLGLPEAADLEAAARRELEVRRLQRLRFSRGPGGGHRFLRQLRALGAGSSPHPRLSTPQLRRLLQHWPTGEPITWEVLLLIGRRAP
jgi:malonyl-CoA O-methyltransferase